jgi:branched-chain amino acid aminotransferase
MAMAPLPEDLFLASLHQLVSIDRDWIPTADDGSLYLRPFMFASEVFLGVKPSAEYLYAVIASPVGSYFKGGVQPVSVWVSNEYTRAAPGGTGAAKCGGNYATSLAPHAQAIENGCDQVVFLDAVERRYVDELGGMNIFFGYRDGTLVTPPLTGTILPGITRDAVMTLARDNGLTVVERPYSLEEWRADAESGRLREAFACGTAAVITPIGTVKWSGGGFTVADGGAGGVTDRLRTQLVDIQRGRAEDRYGWVHRVL